MRQPPLNEVEEQLLLALKKHGRHKTFSEILEGAGITLSTIGQVELADALEARGLIETTTYKLPLEIRAELSAKGLKAANTSRRRTAP